MSKLVYSLDSPRTARLALERLRSIGIAHDSISLAARSDIELERLPDDYAEETTDFNDALKRGIALGGTTGLIAGLIALSIPTFGVTLGGAALLTAVGAAVGGWASALVGTTIPNELRRDFEGEINSGRVILAIKVTPEQDYEVERLMAGLGDGVKPMLLHNGPMAA